MNIFEWIYGKRKEEVKPKEQEHRKHRDVFSTDLPKFFGMSREEMERRAFPVRPEHMKVMGQDGSTYALDSLDNPGNNPFATKNAFVLGSQRIPDAIMGWYVNQGFIGYQSCAVIAQQWLVFKACTMPAEDAARNRWDITVNDGEQITPEQIAKIKSIDERMRLHQNLVELTTFKRVFGIRICLFVVESDDPDYYLKPFNPDGVKPGTYKGISQVDPYWITPLLGDDAVSDPANINFYEPTWWQIGSRKIHRSHLVIVRNGQLADILKPSYLYGGVPLTQQIFERVYAAERTANEGPQLALTKRMNVVKVDLDKAFANPDAFLDRLNQSAQYRDNFGVKVIGQDDEYTQHETSLADLDSVIMTQYQLVAAIAGVPATKLLGTSPKGFNATGEHEIKMYNQMLASIQANDMTPVLRRHYELLVRSEFDNAFKIDPVWNPLDEPTEEELANVNKLKADGYSVLYNTGAIDGSDIRNVLVKDEHSGFSGMSEEVPTDVPESDYENEPEED